jgi:hypothetical protein
VGTHKFYLRQYFRGVVMFVFAFTMHHIRCTVNRPPLEKGTTFP